jgi:hypothetical protein
VLFVLIALVSGYSEEPEEYEAEGVRHIDYEIDQMPVKIVHDGSKRLARSGKSFEEKFDENNQTPAEDRNWQVKPKVKRMSKSGKKVHIYIKNDDMKPKSKKQPSSTTTASSTSTETGTIENETQTRKTPELTTKSDNIRNIKYADKDSVASGSNSRPAVAKKEGDSASDGSDHHEHVVKEKIKIKHHHHHHHHNHVKTVVKKEPYPVEKVVHVPIEKIVEKVIEKKVPYKIEIPVEKIVEKVRKTPRVVHTKHKSKQVQNTHNKKS